MSYLSICPDNLVRGPKAHQFPGLLLIDHVKINYNRQNINVGIIEEIKGKIDQKLRKVYEGEENKITIMKNCHEYCNLKAEEIEIPTPKYCKYNT